MLERFRLGKALSPLDSAVNVDQRRSSQGRENQDAKSFWVLTVTSVQELRSRWSTVPGAV